MKMKINKKLLVFGLIPLAIAMVVAVGYVVNNLTIQADVYEPFSLVEYSIIGDADNWDGVTGCDAEGLTWNTYENGAIIDVQGLYAGEGRAVCARITNLAQADVSYTMQNIIMNENETVHDLCVAAFGEHSLSGTAVQQTTTTNGLGIVVADDAAPVEDCIVKVEVLRG
jgi:hypothetical protein